VLKAWLVIGLIACGGSKSKPDTLAAPTPIDASAVRPVLVLGAATLVADQDGRHSELRIDAEGSLFADANKVATVTSSGQVRLLDGTVILEIAADGKVSIPNESGAPIEIREDGTVLENGQSSVEIAADGKIGGGLVASLGGVSARASGAPDTRRALMLAWIALLLIADRQAK